MKQTSVVGTCAGDVTGAVTDSVASLSSTDNPLESVTQKSDDDDVMSCKHESFTGGGRSEEQGGEETFAAVVSSVSTGLDDS